MQLLAVNYPDADDLSRFECYLDDILGAFMECRWARGAAAILLTLHMIRRPHGGLGDDESLSRGNVLVISKFLAEGKPSESNVILGLWVNTMAFSVFAIIRKAHRAEGLHQANPCAPPQPRPIKDFG